MNTTKRKVTTKAESLKRPKMIFLSKQLLKRERKAWNTSLLGPDRVNHLASLISSSTIGRIERQRDHPPPHPLFDLAAAPHNFPRQFLLQGDAGASHSHCRLLSYTTKMSHCSPDIPEVLSVKAVRGRRLIVSDTLLCSGLSWFRLKKRLENIFGTGQEGLLLWCFHVDFWLGCGDPGSETLSRLP